MSKGERKFILILFIIILIASICIIIQINSEREYDPKIYEEIYSEYNELFENNSSNEEQLSEIANKENKDTTSSNITSSILNETSNTNNKILEKTIQGNNYKVIGKIVIPKIDIKYPIIYQTTDEYLKVAPTKYTGPDVNQVGNLCIVGHNYYNSQFFSKLHELNTGDKVFLTASNGSGKNYVVYDKYEIEETDMSCTSQNTNGNVELTLITCTKNKNNRLVVKCRSI